MNRRESPFDKIKDIIRSAWFIQFVTYFFFAGMAAVTDIGTLYILTEYAHLYYLASAVIAYMLGMIVNYTMNKRFTFKNTNRSIGKQFSVFAIVASIGLGINLLVLYILVGSFGMYYLFAKIIALSISFVWSFTGHKYITFRLLK